MNHHRLLITRFFMLYVCYSVMFSLPVKAQPTNDITNSSGTTLPSPPQFFRFVFITGAVQKTSHRNTEGDYQIRSSIQPCWEGGIDYLHSINGTYFYVLGAHLVVPGRSTIFDLPALESNPSAHYEQNPPDKYKPFDVGLALPLLIEKQWELTARKAFYGKAGVQFNLALNRNFDQMDDFLSDSNGNNVQVFHQLAFTFNNDKPWLTGRLGAGMQWMLKNENLLSIGLTANLSFTDFVSGTYEVTIPGVPDTKGIYTANGSYIGIDVSYGLTRKFRRRIKND